MNLNCYPGFNFMGAETKDFQNSEYYMGASFQNVQFDVKILTDQAGEENSPMTLTRVYGVCGPLK